MRTRGGANIFVRWLLMAAGIVLVETKKNVVSASPASSQGATLQVSTARYEYEDRDGRWIVFVKKKPAVCACAEPPPPIAANRRQSRGAGVETYAGGACPDSDRYVDIISLQYI